MPATVTVINREEMDRQIIRDTQDITRYQPGVFVDRQTSGTDPAKNYGGFTIRGVGGNRVQMQVDGMRVIERITDGTRDLVDLPTMKAVEIFRGPGSVLWGADALGGIVAYRTYDPDDLLKGPNGAKGWAGRLSTSYDSFDGGWQKTAMFARQFTPTWQGLVVASHRSAHEPELSRARADGGVWGCPASARFLPCNVVDPLDIRTLNGLAKLVWRPNGAHEFKLTGEAFNRRTSIDNLWDFNIVSAAGIRNGVYAREQILRRQRLSLSHEWNVGATWLNNVKWQLGVSPQERELTGDRLQTLANLQQRRTLSSLVYKELFAQADLQLNSRFAFAGVSHNLTYGFQGDRTWTDYARLDIVTNLATNVTTATPAGGFNFANATTTRADLYVQDEIKMFGDRLTLSPGLRWANYEIDPRPDANYVIVPGKEPRRLTSSRPIPQIGAMYKIGPIFSVFGRYAEGFKMPTAQQLYTSLPFGNQNLIPNPDLRPEKVKSYEAGVRAQFEKGFVSLGVFHASYRDFIQSLVQINAVDITNINLSRVQVSGVELSGRYALADNVLVQGSMSYQYGKQKTNPAALWTPFDGASPVQGNIGVRYLMPEYKLELDGVVTMAGGVTRASTPNQYKPGGYTAFDAFLTWRPTELLSLRAGVLNVFDRRYFPSTVTAGYLKTATAATAATTPLELQTAPGRTVRLSMQADF